MTLSGIEPATFRLVCTVAQCLNHLLNRVPFVLFTIKLAKIILLLQFPCSQSVWWLYIQSVCWYYSRALNLSPSGKFLRIWWPPNSESDVLLPYTTTSLLLTYYWYYYYYYYYYYDHHWFFIFLLVKSVFLTASSGVAAFLAPGAGNGEGRLWQKRRIKTNTGIYWIFCCSQYFKHFLDAK